MHGAHIRMSGTKWTILSGINIYSENIWDRGNECLPNIDSWHKFYVNNQFKISNMCVCLYPDSKML